MHGSTTPCPEALLPLQALSLCSPGPPSRQERSHSQPHREGTAQSPTDGASPQDPPPQLVGGEKGRVAPEFGRAAAPLSQRRTLLRKAAGRARPRALTQRRGPSQAALLAPGPAPPPYTPPLLLRPPTPAHSSGAPSPARSSHLRDGGAGARRRAAAARAFLLSSPPLRYKMADRSRAHVAAFPLPRPLAARQRGVEGEERAEAPAPLPGVSPIGARRSVPPDQSARLTLTVRSAVLPPALSAVR